VTLTISKTGSGTVTSNPAGITCGATCAASFTAGGTVNLTGGARIGMVFSGWSGGGCTGTAAARWVRCCASSAANMFKTKGDGGLIEFASVEDAVCFTLDFQTRWQAHEGAARPIRFRPAWRWPTCSSRATTVSARRSLSRPSPEIGRRAASCSPILCAGSWAKSLAARFTRAETRKIKGVDELLEVWIHAPHGLPTACSRPPRPVGRRSRRRGGAAPTSRCWDPALLQSHRRSRPRRAARRRPSTS